MENNEENQNNGSISEGVVGADLAAGLKLGIVGSRSFHDSELFSEMVKAILHEIGWPSLVISGGASGSDSLVEIWAREHNVPFQVFLPDWKTFGPSGGPRRNTEIVLASTTIIAFYSRNPKSGTADSMMKAILAGRELYVVDIQDRSFRRMSEIATLLYPHHVPGLE